MVFNKVMEKHRLAILLILIIAIIIAIIKHPELQDRNIVYLEITLIISLLVYELENKYYIIASVIVLFALITIWDVYQEKQIEGFSNKLKKLKNTRIGKTSERFGNVLMSKGIFTLNLIYNSYLLKIKSIFFQATISVELTFVFK